MPLLLTRDDVAQVLQMSDCMDAVEKAIMEEAPAKQHENVKAAREAFDAVEFYE